MSFTLWALGLGMLVGVRHAFEPDHLAAVGTLVSDARSPLRAAWLGAAWGLGHTAALALVAGVLALLGATLPASAQRVLELNGFDGMGDLWLHAVQHEGHIRRLRPEGAHIAGANDEVMCAVGNGGQAGLQHLAVFDGHPGDLLLL